jgi:chromate transporter
MTEVAVPRFTVWFRLLWMFLKVNILSPSGPASIGLLYKEAVAKQLMTETQFVEAVGFSNVLPGSEALKLAMFVGFAAGGIPGVLTALMGAILPPTVMMLIVSAILQRVQHSNWIDGFDGFVAGMSPAVAALIVVVAWELFRATSPKRIDRRAILIAVLSAVAFWFDLPSPLVLLGAGLLGVFLYGQRSYG